MLAPGFGSVPSVGVSLGVGRFIAEMFEGLFGIQRRFSFVRVVANHLGLFLMDIQPLH